MQIGKQIQIVRSPEREIRKATEKKEKPIPVQLPEKKEVEVENFHFSGHMWTGVDWGYSIGYTVST